MDESLSVTDPTDWLQTSTPQVSQVEAALRCQVCKDFFNTPMITSCSHTFCSLCIRRCLTNDGICPICRTPDQEVRLRRNWTVAELVEAFQVARPALIQLGKDLQATNLQISLGKSKRKFDESHNDESGKEDKRCTRQRQTRSQKGASPNPRLLGTETVDAEDGDSEYQPEDGLTSCPICNQRMKEEKVFAHLDVHNNPEDTPDPRSSISSITKPIDGGTRYDLSSKPPDRLPQLSYSLLRDTALRKKLTELGIPSGGPRALLVRRHKEWVNLVNANSDSSRPRTKREMLHELSVWDRSQGRQVSNHTEDSMGSSSVMEKDFDGTAWATSHDDEFQRLISRARKKVGNDADRDHGALISDHETENQETTPQRHDMSHHAPLSPHDSIPPD
ncbi:E3 ubiquitin-protein ligase rad18 [Lobaria immixta]|nr:E3 ubiquitin-protein ligase rad18 [Lobaria immixta]